MIGLRKEKIVFGLLLVTGIMLYFFTDVSYGALLTESVFVYGIMAFFISRMTGTKMEICFSGNYQGTKGNEQKINMTIENGSRIPVFHARTFWAVENKLTGEKTSLIKTVFLLPLQKKRD